MTNASMAENADCIELIKPFLNHVAKPQRYLGGELNQKKKDWQSYYIS
jgi:hypothetical protein